MIRRLDVRNFKGLSGEVMSFGALTLLTGVNGAGKSSAIQALLLVVLANRERSGVIPLNESFGLTLGSGVDVVDHGSGDNEIAISVASDVGGKATIFRAEEDKRYLTLISSRASLPPIGRARRVGAFGFLAAERNGPRESMALPSTAQEIMEISHCGDNLAALLSEHERRLVLRRLVHPAAPNLLSKQVEAWLGEFTPGTQLRVLTDPELGRAAISLKCGDVGAEWLRPGNFGFGISYCLPIIVAALLAARGSLLIVDSPEAHLHPSAQSTMGQFLARVAYAGIQVVMETHSDHILNGVRIASLRRDGSPSRDEIVINHFSRLGTPRVTRINIRPNGDLSERPSEFFDQTEQDLAEIVRQRFGGTLDRSSKR